MADAPVYNRKNPLRAKLRSKYDLTGPGAEKHTAHYVIDLTGSGMEFLPGDSLAILPTNCPDLVADVVAALGCEGDETVTGPSGEPGTLSEVLRSECAITQPDKKFLNTIVERAGDAAADLARLLEPAQKAELSDFLWGREIIDFLFMYPTVKFEAQEFVSILKKLNVRLYSIASSLRALPDQVDLTVATVTYTSFGRNRKGVTTNFLANIVEPNVTDIPCFITPGKGFRLPEPDDDTPIIMCGPGTGIAPFRAFVQERKATNAKGKAWLFFGDQYESSCFFYKDEWEAALADGTLTRLDTAFSRDQAHKIYVQHRIKEAGKEIWEWLDEGAIFYVCGDAERMAKDVDAALHEIVAEHGGKSPEEAADYMEQMKKDKRYRRDVY